MQKSATKSIDRLHKVGPIEYWVVTEAELSLDPKSDAVKYGVDVRTIERWRHLGYRPVYAGDKPGRKPIAYWSRQLLSPAFAQHMLAMCVDGGDLVLNDWCELLRLYPVELPRALEFLQSNYNRQALARLLSGFCKNQTEYRLCVQSGLVQPDSGNTRFARPSAFLCAMIAVQKNNTVTLPITGM